MARRSMFAARDADSLPKDWSAGLLALHERKPFPDTAEEIDQIAAAVKDPSFRVQVSAQGIHVYNRDGQHRGSDPFQLWPLLGLENDPGHAFYMGVELARAQVACQLGKRYTQDQELRWGVASAPRNEDLTRQSAPGTTLTHKTGGRGK